MTAIARRYARALFEVAVAKSALDAVADDVRAVTDEITGDGDLADWLARGDLSAGAIAKLLDGLAQGRHPLVQNLLRTLRERRRHPVLLELRQEFDRLVRESKGEILGIAESARPLGAEQRQELSDLASRLSGKQVRLEFHENPELIGGVRLRLGNTLYDGSVATVLEELQQRLLSAPLA